MNTQKIQNDTLICCKQDTIFIIIFAISFSHLLNDILQSVLPALYPMLSISYHLSLFQIGLITAVYQITGSILQPLIGFLTDRRPLPYFLPLASVFSMMSILLLANTQHYYQLLLGATCLGFGSSIFHPEASRIVRIASGGRFCFAQSVFQVGGNAGSALGPLVAALLISQQYHIVWFAIIAVLGFFVLSWISQWYISNIKKIVSRKTFSLPKKVNTYNILKVFLMLIALTSVKYTYLTSINNFYTFFIIEKFHLSIHQAQYLLFLYLSGIAIGTIFCGPVGDLIGTRTVIWISIIGILPFTLLLPHVSLPFVAGFSVIIGMILASAFPAIIVFAQELLPEKTGTVAGTFFGLAFGIGALSSALLGALGDIIGKQNLFTLCSFLPLLGCVAVFLPKLQE